MKWIVSACEFKAAVKEIKSMRLHKSLDYVEEIEQGECENIVSVVLDAIGVHLEKGE